MNCWIIDTPEQWAIVADRLKHAGYKLCGTQYSVGDVEGLHVTFWAHGKPVVEFITHNDVVGKAIYDMPI